MGGRGAKLESGGFRFQEFKSTGEIAGVKVLEPINRNKDQVKMPHISNTPGTSYLTLNKKGDRIKKFRQYGADRLPVLDIDFDHDHGWGVPHVQEWKDGKRVDEGRPITQEERIKYAKILEAAGY